MQRKSQQLKTIYHRIIKQLHRLILKFSVGVCAKKISSHLRQIVVSHHIESLQGVVHLNFALTSQKLYSSGRVWRKKASSVECDFSFHFDAILDRCNRRSQNTLNDFLVSLTPM